MMSRNSAHPGRQTDRQPTLSNDLRKFIVNAINDGSLTVTASQIRQASRRGREREAEREAVARSANPR